MIENKPLSQKSILILVIVLFAFISAIGLAYFSSPNNLPPVAVGPTIIPIAEPTVMPTSEPTVMIMPTPSMDIASWETYRNEKVGFSLKYPKEWGSVEVEEYKEAIYGPGEQFYVKFANNSYGINIKANTTDFTPYEYPVPVFQGGDSMDHCKEVAKQVFTLKECEEIAKNITTIFYGFYLESGMFGDGKSIYFFKEAFIKNQASKYSTITISLVFDAYQNDNLIEMTESQISDIAKNHLPNLDQKAIDLFDQIISTFRFIE